MSRVVLLFPALLFCLAAPAYAYLTDSEGACKGYRDFCVDDLAVTSANDGADADRAMRHCIRKAANADNANGQACLAEQNKHKLNR